MKKRISKTEKYIIAISSPDEYNLFMCPEHGVYAQGKHITDLTCAYCKKECPKLENAKELHEQYRKELGV